MRTIKTYSKGRPFIMCLSGVGSQNLAIPVGVYSAQLWRSLASWGFWALALTTPLRAQENCSQVGLSQFELYRYDAQHAFMNEARPQVYGAVSAKTAWERGCSSS
jgi:hypothetical protein